MAGEDSRFPANSVCPMSGPRSAPCYFWGLATDRSGASTGAVLPAPRCLASPWAASSRSTAGMRVAAELGLVLSVASQRELLPSQMCAELRRGSW